MNPYESPQPIDEGSPREWLTLAGVCNVSYGCSCFTSALLGVVLSLHQFRTAQWWALVAVLMFASIGYFWLWYRYHPKHR